MKKKFSLWVLCLVLAVCSVSLLACKKKPNDPDPQPGEYQYSLSDTSVGLSVGQTKQLTVSVTPEKSIAPTFVSSADSVATVSDSGLITAVAEGTATITVTVDEQALTCSVRVVAYTLNFIELELERGQTKQLAVSDPDNKPLTAVYGTSNSEVAAVSEGGLVTAGAPGTATITATVDGVPLTCAVTVREKYTYSLDRETLDLAKGAQAKLTAQVTPQKDDYSLTFTSENASVATVEPGTGRVTAVGAGTTRIVCMIDGNELTCAVTVTEYTLSDTTLTLRTGATATLTVTADPVRDMDVAFASSDTDVVSVTGGGIVTAGTPGTATITVTVNGATLTCAVTVNPAYLYDLNETEIRLAPHDTKQLTVVVDPEKADVETVWSTSASDVASVSQDGLVTANGLGTATITAVADGHTLTCTVNVVMDSTLTQVDASGSYNLSALGANKTLDWFYYGDSEYTERMMGNAGLLEKAPKPTQYFGDYKARIGWSNGTKTVAHAGRTDGWVYFDDVVEYTVTLNNTVQSVMIFAGAYQATNTVSFIYNGVTLEKYAFTSSGSSVNKVLTFTPDTSVLGDETATLTVRMEKEFVADGANVCLIAAAVVGNATRPADSVGTAEYAGTELQDTQHSKIDLTAKGTLDWYYLNFENDDGDRKQDGSAILKDTLQVQNKSAFWDYRASFRWSDGTKWTDNPKDKGDDAGSWTWCESEAERGTNNGYCGAEASIWVNIEAGKTVVYLYANGWNSSYDVLVYDSEGREVLSQNVFTHSAAENHAFEIAVTIDTATADSYAFRIVKTNGDGNVGLAAVAVASAQA